MALKKMGADVVLSGPGPLVPVAAPWEPGDTLQLKLAVSSNETPDLEIYLEVRIVETPVDGDGSVTPGRLDAGHRARVGGIAGGLGPDRARYHEQREEYGCARDRERHRDRPSGVHGSRGHLLGRSHCPEGFDAGASGPNDQPLSRLTQAPGSAPGVPMRQGS